MTTTTSKTKLFQAAAIMATLAASVALAQVRQVQLGNPMDANPGVGNGGSNTPVSGYVPINNNEVITGNVSGLKYFHGPVGTFSPYQFQGTLGSASLNNFARQSAGGVPGAGGPSQVYYLPSTTVSTAGGNLYSAPLGSGFDSLLVPRTAVSPTASSTQIQALSPIAQSRSFERALPTIPLQPGEPGAVLNSPLFALRYDTIPPEGQEKVDKSQLPTTPGQGGPDVPDQFNNQSTPNNNPNNVPNNNANPSDNPNDTAAARDPRIKSQSSEGIAQGKLPKKPDLRIGSAYANLLDQFSKTEMDVTANADPRSISLSTPTDRANRDSNAQSDIDPLTGRPRQMLARNTTPEISGVPGLPGTPGAERLGPTPRPGQDMSPTAKRLQDLPTNTLTAGSKLKPVKTLSEVTPGAAVAPFDVLMARGQAMLKDGRYLESALAFQNALATHPDDALALVGWAHADIGAGFYSTAATNLKFVYTRKPEMISVKYDPTSFIPAARVQFVIQDLEKLTTSKEQGNLASFLYCYLCYQSGRTDQLKSELQKWGDRPDHDDWQAVVSRAWTAPAAPTTKPATP